MNTINFNFLSIIFTLLNASLWFFLIIVIISTIKKVKKYINKFNQMEKNIDTILKNIDNI